MTPVLNKELPDAALWELVCQGDKAAYESVVERYQSLVSAVAYNACGDLALSEDVAQEAFWAAWRQREALAQPERLRAWLCGIARNLGHNVRRRAARAGEAVPLGAAADVPASSPGPLEAAVSGEEEALVWQTLEQIPEQYREPLILYYREAQSVAEVSAALELSPDAVKQRLARGRNMLQDRLAEVVEGVLRRSRPGRNFTVAVVTGLATLSAGSRVALAAGGAAGPALKAAGAGMAGGLVGGILGPVIGLLGGWVGTSVSAELATTKGERDIQRRTGRRMLLVSFGFCLVLVGMILALVGRVPVYGYLIGWAAWMVAFGVYVVAESVGAARALRRLAAAGGPAEPNDSPLRRRLEKQAAHYRGRVYRTRATLLGLPLIDVNVRDPGVPGGTGRVARGWIAIGDDARGILLGVGGVAQGFLALGGRSVGVLSFGGVAFGVVAVGGVALGGFALGGMAAGILALGGLGIGWQAGGGGALAWDVACGGGAVAWHAVYGGAAYAHDFALGGAAGAAHANDDAARAVLLDHWLKRALDWYAANLALFNTVLIAVCLLPLALMPTLMYRRADPVSHSNRE